MNRLVALASKCGFNAYQVRVIYESWKTFSKTVVYFLEFFATCNFYLYHMFFYSFYFECVLSYDVINCDDKGNS